jgi:hypothetical protein
LPEAAAGKGRADWKRGGWVSPVRIRPVGGAAGCLVMVLVSVGLSVVLTVLLNVLLR